MNGLNLGSYFYPPPHHAPLTGAVASYVTEVLSPGPGRNDNLEIEQKSDRTNIIENRRNTPLCAH